MRTHGHRIELSVGVKRDPSARRGVIEVAIKSGQIASELQSGKKLGLGVYRMEGKSERKYLAWNPTRTDKPNSHRRWDSNNCHVPERFGTSILD